MEDNNFLIMETKKCGRCHNIKPKTEFYRRLNGLMSQCKECTKKISLERYKNNTQSIKDRTVKYYYKNREKLLEYSRRYREQNKEKVKECMRQWREKNPNYSKDYWKNIKNKIK